MTLAVTYQPWGETLDELVSAGRRAEEAGATVLWTSELHRSATITAAALACGTSRARVGTSIALAFTRSPMITALEALDLDELSGGRFLLGLGSGVKKLNEAWHNVAFGKPAPHIEETIRNIRTFWQTCTTGDAIELEGDFEPMSIRGYERPFEVPVGQIPIYLAAMGPVMTRLAGRVADGWISHELCSPHYLEEKILPGLYRGLNDSGRTLDDGTFDAVVSACCSVDEDLDVARRRASGLVGFYATVRTYADFFAFHGLEDDQQTVIDAFVSGLGADHLATSVSAEMVDALTMSGTSDEVIDKIRGYDGLATSVKLSPPTHGLAGSETRAAQEQIFPLIAALTGTAT